MNYKSTIALLWISGAICTYGAGDSQVLLADPEVDIHDKQSVVRGAEHFKKSCLSCHSISYALYNPVVIDAGILKENMPVWPDDAWGGHPPPDLSLWAQVTSPAFIYTYLTSYYEDTKSPTGFNNLAYPGTSMPNPFASMQGKQVLITSENTPKHSPIREKDHWYRVVKLEKQGSMSPEDFDQYVKDITNFLHYISDPSVDERAALGPWVMLYMLASVVVSSAIFYYSKRKKS